MDLQNVQSTTTKLHHQKNSPDGSVARDGITDTRIAGGIGVGGVAARQTDRLMPA